MHLLLYVEVIKKVWMQNRCSPLHLKQLFNAISIPAENALWVDVYLLIFDYIDIRPCRVRKDLFHFARLACNDDIGIPANYLLKRRGRLRISCS
jgi:hypothetical protein